MIVEHVLTTETAVPDLATFRKRYPEAMILKVDGRSFYGQCHDCGSPILDGDVYYSRQGGVLACRDCGAGHGYHVEQG